jgi:hypothetical protein
MGFCALKLEVSSIMLLSVQVATNTEAISLLLN